MKRKFTLKKTIAKGFSVSPDGTVNDFVGTLGRGYYNLKRASGAIRRKYKDSSITITELNVESHTYEVDDEKLFEIATEIN